MTIESNSSEKRFQILGKTLLGYYLPTNPFVISLIAIFAALTCVMTMTIDIPVPATGGYINIGDFVVMFTGLMFGPIIGGLAGGIGSSLADIFLGWPLYALPTLIIKGLEGFVVGIIANPKKETIRINLRDVVAVIIGGLIMVSGYFLVEAFIMNYGIINASIEVPGNLFQFIFGAVASILLIIPIRRNVVRGEPQVFEKVFVVESNK
jgi:uncharacterized membrane protein